MAKLNCCRYRKIQHPTTKISISNLTLNPTTENKSTRNATSNERNNKSKSKPMKPLLERRKKASLYKENARDRRLCCIEIKQRSKTASSLSLYRENRAIEDCVFTIGGCVEQNDQRQCLHERV